MVDFVDDLERRRRDLGTKANTVTPNRSTPVLGGADRRELRRDRFGRRQVSRGWLLEQSALTSVDRLEAIVTAPRPAKCGTASGALVGVHMKQAPGATARFSGLQSCASIWSCPCCSSLIRARRADEVQRAAEWWEQQRRSFLFVTFTARHKLEDSLQQSLSALTDAFTRLIRGAPWKRFAMRHGIRHMIKAVEITLSWRNGWHAHLHVLWFTDSRESAAALDEARDWLFSRWSTMIDKAGGRRPNQEHGVDVRTVQNGSVVAKYVAKLQEHDKTTPRRWSVGKEMARIDSKKGRLESMVPFDLLDVDGAEPDEVERQQAAWVEYVKVTKGRRAMTWSRGLKAAAGIDEVEDEEILADEDGVVIEEQVVFVIKREHWRRIQNSPDLIARILELVERRREHEVGDFVPIMFRT